MKAIIRKIYMKNVVTSTGKKFDKICIECDCVDEATNYIRTRTAEMSPEYATKYFNYCGISSKQAIGMEVNVELQKRAFNGADGQLKTFTSIKYLNFFDEDGKPIIMQKKEEVTKLPF